MPGCSCPLSKHQAETAAAVMMGESDIIFNTSVTGDGKSLAATLPVLLDPTVRMVGLYPTNELVEDQLRGQREYHVKFGLDPQQRIDLLYGQELSRRIELSGSNRAQELSLAIAHKPVLLTNPDLFHLMLHFRYRQPAYTDTELPMLMAQFPDYWMFDEFHIFGPHQESAVLNSLCFIRAATQGKKMFLFTSATPKVAFVEQLQQAGFSVKTIAGEYSSQAQPGYREILQLVDLEFVQLRDKGVLDWLQENADKIKALLKAESRGRGLVVLNSVAQVGQAVRLLKALLPEIDIQEISGRIDRKERRIAQSQLRESERPVLVLGTSAVDVGVDFKIHLLVFESNNAATVIQRLGRLGRHPGFQSYRAFCLLPNHAPWIHARLEESFSEGDTVERTALNEAIYAAFDPPKTFEQYRRQWGAVQAQGMIRQIQQGKPNSAEVRVMQPVCDRITTALTPVYSHKKLESARRYWHCLGKEDVGKAAQQELLRFRGGTTLQAAVWDNNRFYTYDLLRILPYTSVEVVEAQDFLSEAAKQGYSEDFFSYAQVYLKVHSWLEDRLHISLRCGKDSSELDCCDLILLRGLRIENHPQIQNLQALSQTAILSFLIPLGKRQSHWDIARSLRLSPLFGLHQLTDASEKSYACAFNQDALLLKAFAREHRLTKFCRQAESLFF